MKLPRPSVNSVLAAVATIAIDCMAMRAVISRPSALIGGLDFIAFGSLPMANLLTLGIVLRIRRRGRIGSFLRGFEVSGWMALFAGIGCAILRPQWIDFYLVSILDPIGELTGLDVFPAWADAESFVLAPALLFLPQGVVALAGGWLTQRIGAGRGIRGPEPDPVDHGPGRRVRLGSLTVVLILAVTPALAIEGILRWTVDPQSARLGVGTEAILQIEDSAGFWVKLPGRTEFVLPTGSRVRIAGDDDPSSVGKASSKGTGPVGDRRMVRVTLLDGEGVGGSTRLPRCWLQPVR